MLKSRGITNVEPALVRRKDDGQKGLSGGQ